ncbi:hypothetical protein N658DRAFT_351881 [Parathielavia hyrcaniae]|uniref:Uncharacterized protein n=1 Tax=Parathielavia hyrcaniae TaxID=113614 RepID=A0AAN6Q1Z4_9PEZI|nr:hypothetical protein N658DRAFT_351881 [Parathielavia hyrcaniae]
MDRRCHDGLGVTGTGSGSVVLFWGITERAGGMFDTNLVLFRSRNTSLSIAHIVALTRRQDGFSADAAVSVDACGKVPVLYSGQRHRNAETCSNPRTPKAKPPHRVRCQASTPASSGPGSILGATPEPAPEVSDSVSRVRSSRSSSASSDLSQGCIGHRTHAEQDTQTRTLKGNANILEDALVVSCYHFLCPSHSIHERWLSQLRGHENG